MHWTVEYKGKDGFAFKSIWGKYLVADTNGALNANQKNAGLFAFFKVIKIKGRYNKIHLQYSPYLVIDRSDESEPSSEHDLFPFS